MRALELLIALLIGASAPAQATSPAEVSTGLEAWYHMTAPPQEGLVPVSPFEEQTLHVGATGGAETARTYLTLLVQDIPSGATITGGTLTLPVHPDAGTARPDAAVIRVCAAAPPPRSDHGSLEEPPEVDCNTSSEAHYQDGDAPRFTADLSPFRDLRSSGLALVAGDSPDAWHVAFYAKGHPAGRPITASITFTLPPAFDDDDGFDDFGFVPNSGAEVGGLQAPAPQALLDPSVPVFAPDPGDEPTFDVDRASSDGFFADPTAAYLSWVLLIPLLLLAFVGYFSRALVVEDPEP